MAKKYGAVEPEFIRVAALDIESLSTRMNAAVTEIGYVVCNLPKGVTYADWSNHIESSGTVQLDLLEQLHLGRHVDPGTIDFQHRTFGADKYREIIYGRPGHTADFYYAADGLEVVRKALKGVDELWMNHPTFDAGRLNTLAEALGIYNGLWYFGCEMDIHSIKYKLGLEVEGEDPNAHRGLADCYYNLNILRELALTHYPVWREGHGYVWKERRNVVTRNP